MGCNHTANEISFAGLSQSSPGEDGLQQTLFTHICKEDEESQSSPDEDGLQPLEPVMRKVDEINESQSSPGEDGLQH